MLNNPGHMDTNNLSPARTCLCLRRRVGLARLERTYEASFLPSGLEDCVSRGLCEVPRPFELQSMYLMGETNHLLVQSPSQYFDRELMALLDIRKALESLLSRKEQTVHLPFGTSTLGPVQPQEGLPSSFSAPLPAQRRSAPEDCFPKTSWITSRGSAINGSGIPTIFSRPLGDARL